VVKAILEKDPYLVRAVYLQGVNPLLTYPNALRTYDALMKLDFLAVADMFMTPTAALADIVLPAASYLEFDCIRVPPFSYAQISAQQKVVRTGECRSDYEIMRGLAEKAGQGESFPESEEQCLDLVLKPAGLSFSELRKIGIRPGEKQYKRHEKNGFGTPSKKVEIYSNRLQEWKLDPLPVYYEPPETSFSEPELAKEYPLVLNSAKPAVFRHSQGRQLDTRRRLHPEPVVNIHPQTAGELGIKEGDLVTIETRRGRIKQKARLAPTLDPRVVSVDFGWWFPEKGIADLYGWTESNVNILTDDKPPFNREIGSSNLRGMLCKVYKE
jgi:anaerobic selenocysteine-containing dehydrogenase